MSLFYTTNSQVFKYILMVDFDFLTLSSPRPTHISAGAFTVMTSRLHEINNDDDDDDSIQFSTDRRHGITITQNRTIATTTTTLPQLPANRGCKKRKRRLRETH